MSLFHYYILFFVFKQKTAYEMRISDWSSDVCSSDLLLAHGAHEGDRRGADVTLADQRADLLCAGDRGVGALHAQPAVREVLRDARADGGGGAHAVVDVERDVVGQRIKDLRVDHLTVAVERRRREDHVELAVRVAVRVPDGLDLAEPKPLRLVDRERHGEGKGG